MAISVQATGTAPSKPHASFAPQNFWRLKQCSRAFSKLYVNSFFKFHADYNAGIILISKTFAPTQNKALQ